MQLLGVHMRPESDAYLLHCWFLLMFTIAATPYPQQQGQQQQQRQLLAEGNKPASLTVAGPDCIEAFYNTTAAHYADDDTCSFMINQAFAATAQSGCPQGGTGDASPTQKCIQKTEVSEQNVSSLQCVSIIVLL
jgi:hypothetical protein